MSIKYVVFDWDGTLADTYPVISAAYNYTFDKLGLPRIPYDEIKSLTSTLPNKDTLGFIFKERKDTASKAYYEYITAHHAANLQAMPSAKEVLEFCRKQGLKTYLLTNKKTLYIKEEIAKLGFENLFDKVIAAGEYAEDKPHPIATHAVFDGKRGFITRGQIRDGMSQAHRSFNDKADHFVVFTQNLAKEFVPCWAFGSWVKFHG